MQNIMFLWLQRSRGRCPQSPTRPLAGISCVKRGHNLIAFHPRFRPLAGISCVASGSANLHCPPGFRPLAGISCVGKLDDLAEGIGKFPSPRGDKLCLKPLLQSRPESCFRPLAGISCVVLRTRYICSPSGFRPLAGISCVDNSTIIRKAAIEFPSPRGDKLCPGTPGCGRFLPVSVPSRG